MLSFRHDINGLRGLAGVVAVLFHSGHPLRGFRLLDGGPLVLGAGA